MKTLIPLVISLLLTACATIDHGLGRGLIDENLVGIWVGEYKKEDGTRIEWTQVRNETGRYLTFFKVRKASGDTSESVESGNWWVEDHLFHEVNPKWAKAPYVYKYAFYDTGCLSFEQTESGDSSRNRGRYSFTECRKAGPP